MLQAKLRQLRLSVKDHDEESLVLSSSSSKRPLVRPPQQAAPVMTMEPTTATPTSGTTARLVATIKANNNNINNNYTVAPRSLSDMESLPPSSYQSGSVVSDDASSVASNTTTNTVTTSISNRKKNASLENFKQNFRRGLAAAGKKLNSGNPKLSSGAQKLLTPTSSCLSSSVSLKLEDDETETKTVSTVSDEEAKEQQQEEMDEELIGRETNQKKYSYSSSSNSFLGNTRNLVLTDSLSQWLLCANALWESPEMLALRKQTLHVLACVRHSMLQTVLIPLTLPLSLVTGNSRFLLAPPSSSSRPREAGSPLDQVVSLPTQTMGLFGHIACQIMGDLMSLLVPVHKNQRRHYQLVKQGSEVLERLKLDYGMNEGTKVLIQDKQNHNQQEQRQVQKTVQQILKSAFLLRVVDLDLQMPQDESKCESLTSPPKMIAFLDLSQTDNMVLIQEALDQLVSVGLGLLSSNPTVQLHNPEYHVPLGGNGAGGNIAWSCQGGTNQLLRKMKNQSALEQLRTLQDSPQALVWSGKYKEEAEAGAGYSRQFALYLTRGMVPHSPLKLLELLWDNNRTGEYNQHCLYRKTAINLSRPEKENDPDNNKVSHDGTGSKVIQSETKVPMTSFTVKITCLMHCRPLPKPDHGYVIVSRSLCHGPAGLSTHPNAASSPGKSEQIWGINVIRRVPGHPDWTDLTNLSQVGFSAGLPQFLTSQIALRSVQEFFTNVRKSASQTN